MKRLFILFLLSSALSMRITFAQDSLQTFTPGRDSTFVPLLPIAEPVSQDWSSPAQSDTTSIFMQDLIHFVRVGAGIFSAPLLFDRQDWQLAGLGILATASLSTADRRIKDWALANQNKTDDLLFYIDHYYGKGYSLLFSWGLYGYGALTENEKLRKLGRNTTEALVFSGAVTGALKLLIGRRRPYAGKNHLVFRPFQFRNNDYQAMPSGHTTVSFAVSTVLAHSFDNWYWKTFCYGSAGLVGAARIYHNKHWFSDVVLGALIGYSVGSYVVHFDERKGHDVSNRGLHPVFGLGYLGLRYGF